MSLAVFQPLSSFLDMLSDMIEIRLCGIGIQFPVSVVMAQLEKILIKIISLVTTYPYSKSQVSLLKYLDPGKDR